MIIGLTGGIGSGKSTVAQMFKALGVPVYDSDKEAKALMTNSKSLRKAIIALFGETAYHGQNLNRKYIASRVFTNKNLLQELNAVVHPAVKDHFKAWVKEQNAPYVIQESALIFEEQNAALYDAVILVVAPEETRLQRVIERDGTTREEVLSRMAHQLSDKEKAQLANFTIQNINLEPTKEQVVKIHGELLSEILKH